MAETNWRFNQAEPGTLDMSVSMAKGSYYVGFTFTPEAESGSLTLQAVGKGKTLPLALKEVARVVADWAVKAVYGMCSQVGGVAAELDGLKLGRVEVMTEKGD